MTVLLSCLSRFAGVSHCVTAVTVRDTFSNRIERSRTCMVSVLMNNTPLPLSRGEPLRCHGLSRPVPGGLSPETVTHCDSKNLSTFQPSNFPTIQLIFAANEQNSNTLYR